MRLLCIVLGILSVRSLIVPVFNSEQRCMVAFTFGEKETVKLDIKFPPIPHRVQGEIYEIAVKNTDNNESVYYKAEPGTYKKELQLDQNIVYEICFWCATNRNVGTLHIDYTAMVEFYFKQEEIKVPDKILKNHELTSTYMNAERIKEIGDRFIQMQAKRSEMEELSFQKTKSMGSTLAMLSIAELGLILVAAIFQIILLRGLISKQNFI